MSTHYEPSQFLEGQQTLGEIFQLAGYATAFVGKWHLGGDFYEAGTENITRDPGLIDYGHPFGTGPRAHGFDYSFVLPEGIQDPPYAYFEDDRLVGDPAELMPWAKGTYGPYGSPTIHHAGIGMPYWDSVKVGPDLMTQALGFIDRHRASHGSDKPFFLYYAATSAHYPYKPPETFFGRAVRNATLMCFRQDMVYELDLAVGVLVEKLKAENILQDTVLIFTSDNGGTNTNCGHDTSGPNFSGYKGLITEGGHRVPFLVRWGYGRTYVVPPNTVRKQLMGVHDLTATLANLVDVPLAADQAQDSFDMLLVWLGERPDSSPVRDHLIAEARWNPPNIPTNPKFAYYEGNWKLVVEKSSVGFRPIELYNLTADPAEFSNQRNVKTWLVKEMLARFKLRYAGPRSAPTPA
jgi:arylsulfatase A-like enzyme